MGFSYGAGSDYSAGGHLVSTLAIFKSLAGSRFWNVAGKKGIAVIVQEPVIDYGVGVNSRACALLT